MNQKERMQKAINAVKESIPSEALKELNQVVRESQNEPPLGKSDGSIDPMLWLEGINLYNMVQP